MKRISPAIVPMFLILGCEQNEELPVEEIKAYDVLVVSKSNITLRQEYAASIQGKQSTKIIPRIEGHLQEVHIKEGQRVSRGQILFTLDQAERVSEMRAAEANVAVSRAAVASAELHYESRKRLLAKGIVSSYEIKAAENQLEMAKAQLKQSEAQLETAKTNVSYTVLKSPSDGIVGKLSYRAGDYVAPAMQDGLTTIADNEQMYVYFSLTERDVLTRMHHSGSFEQMVAAFPKVQLQTVNGDIYPQHGSVISISGVVETSTGALSALAVFDNADGILLSGSTGRLIIQEEHQGVIVIPQTATFEIMDKTYVYRVVDGVAVSTIIEVYPQSDGVNYLVTKGLSVGDEIIATGAGYVRDGERVQKKGDEAK